MGKKEEGFVDTTGGKVWYEIVGEEDKTPLIAIHGGPGYPHDSLEPLEELADERKVIFYDQLGCGNSERAGKDFWTLENYVEELGELVKFLKLKEYHLLGHSWGCGLIVAFALTIPEGLKSLVLSNPYISTPLWEKEAKKLIKKLPKNLQGALKKDPEDEDYKKALKEFYFRHLYRQKELSVPTLRAEHKSNLELYNYMWGPNEFTATGTLKDYDLTPQLSQLNVPALLLCGRFDEATPESTEYFRTLIPNAKMEVFEKSAHMPHWTEREKYIKTVRDFLRSAK